MKKYLLGIVLVFILVGCGQYTEPKPGVMSGKVILQPDVFKDSHLEQVNYILTIDGQVAKDNQNLRLTVGKHKLDLLVAVFSKQNIKRAHLEKLELNVKNNNNYYIKIKTDKNKFIMGEKSTAMFIIKEGNRFLTTKQVQFLDANTVQEQENTRMVQDSIVYSAILSAGL